MKNKITSAILAGVLALTTLSGCGSKAVPNQTPSKQETEKTTITLMLDRDNQVDTVGTFLVEKYPDVDFDIVVGRTGVSYLSKAAENDDLPDVIVSSGTWGRAGSSLYPYLYDFSATDIASEFYTVYLDNYTTTDGRVYWLPGCASIEGVLANKKLFAGNNIALPTDYASFVEACQQFTALGIRPYASDYKYNYTDAYLLQSWSIPLLQSEAGKTWRTSFEAGETDILDETIGLAMFEKLDAFFDLTGVTEEDATRGYGKTFSDFCDGNVAMIRQSTNIGEYYGAGMQEEDIVLLPYFGETESDNWYFTTPSFAVAMNGAIKGTKNEDLCLEIVRTLFSQECMNVFADQYNSFTAYNKGISFEIDQQFENIKQYVDTNHMYSYLSQDNFQTASYTAVQKMITENATPEEALAVFNETVVQTPEDQPVAAVFETSYSRQWTENGNAAMSATLNTLTHIADCDILLAPAVLCPGSIYAGDYTSEELSNLLLGGGINLYTRTITGAEVKAFVAAAVGDGGANYNPISLSTLPGVSGCTMVVSKTADGKYQLDDLLVNGEPIKEDASFKFVYAYTTPDVLRSVTNWNANDHDGMDVAASETAENLDLETYEGFTFPAQHAADLWLAYFAEGGTIATPSDYIQVNR